MFAYIREVIVYSHVCIACISQSTLLHPWPCLSLSLSISRYIPIIYRTLENDERGHVHEISRASYVDACTAWSTHSTHISKVRMPSWKVHSMPMFGLRAATVAHHYNRQQPLRPPFTHPLKPAIRWAHIYGFAQIQFSDINIPKQIKPRMKR